LLFWAAMRISVIVPCRDAARWLAECLASCLASPLCHEIIVVDDGSSDGSAAVARSIAGGAGRQRVIVIEQPAAGGNVARNRGFEIARGDAIQWLDADDRIGPDKLARQTALLERHPGVDVAFSDFRYQVHEEDGRVWLSEAIVRPRSGDMLADLLADRWRPPAAYLIRRRLAERLHGGVGWNPATPCAQDREYWTMAAILGGRFRHVAGADAIYRRHGATVSTTHLRRRLDAHLALLGRFERELLAAGALTSARRAAHQVGVIAIGRELAAIDPRAARELAASLPRQCPAGEHSRDLSPLYRLAHVLAGPGPALRLAALRRWLRRPVDVRVGDAAIASVVESVPS
jgi:glycosyltransferase involved in cell wall biosynthesis